MRVLPPLVAGSTVLIRTTLHDEWRGTVTAWHGHWLQLTTDTGSVLINATHIVWARVLAGTATSSPPAAAAAACASDDAAWSDTELRMLVEGFLDDADLRQLARRTGRSRQQIVAVRQAWECARGNVPEDGMPPAVRALVPRLRRLLTA